MKNKLYILYTFLITGLFVAGCTKDFDEINTDPNNPNEVSTSALMTYTQKQLLDDIRDEWFSGRQSLAYAQYFAQRNYTEEDRYQLRQNTNNTYWILIYNDIRNLQEIINLNTDPASKERVSTFGNNENQIAAARILKAWAFQILTDAYGDIPYFEAFQAETGVLTPNYTPQSEIYADLVKELTEASNQINVAELVFNTGDIIYNGDPVKWKKFANSLKMRVALRASKVPGFNAQQYITEAVAAGVFESNADNAAFKYLGVAPNNAPMFDAYFTSNRNDFTLAKPFVDLLTGRDDILNNKQNPFEGLLDPRLTVWAVPAAGEGDVTDIITPAAYKGIPYGIPNSQASAARSGTVNFKSEPFGALPAGRTIVVAADAPLVYMDYAEVCFILSEVNGWDETWYRNGVRASLEFWRDAVASSNVTNKVVLEEQKDSLGKVAIPSYEARVEAYLAALPPANIETVLTQKYIAYFMQGYQAWALYRRTGYPKILVKPGEVTHVTGDGTSVIFQPLVGNDIPRRLTYPVSEQTLNPDSYDAAKAVIGEDALSTPVWWDVD